MYEVAKHKIMRLKPQIPTELIALEFLYDLKVGLLRNISLPNRAFMVVLIIQLKLNCT